MKVITLLVDSGPAYDPMEMMSALDHQSLQLLKESTIRESVEKRKVEILEAVANGTPLPEKAKFPLDKEHIAILFNAETGEPIKPLDDVIVKAYQEYMALPKAGRINSSEIYPNWVIIVGLAFVHPHPHRHFDGKEFYHRLGLWPELAERFLPK